MQSTRRLLSADVAGVNLVRRTTKEEYLKKLEDIQKTVDIIEQEGASLGKDVTVTVQKTGVGGTMAEMGLGNLDTNKVFGVKLTDLEEWTD